MDKEVYIVSGCRTAIGKFQGQFTQFSAAELGSIVIGVSVKRADMGFDEVEQVIMGQVLTTGQGQNPARQAAIGAQLSNRVPAYTVNMMCGSGLKAIVNGYQAIKSGDYHIVVAGGQENMTRAHHSAYIRGAKLGGVEFTDTLLTDGLTDAFNKISMGQTVEALAQEFRISRAIQDQYAYESQMKAKFAIEHGHFVKEIVCIPDERMGRDIKQDEYPRFDCTIEKLQLLDPVFDQFRVSQMSLATGAAFAGDRGYHHMGTVTAGNSSGINDGAAAVVLCSGRKINEKGYTPLARVVAFAEVGLEPMRMALGPVEAVNKVLERCDWERDEVDLFELNEAFAAQCIAVTDFLGVDKDKINISGGAIALGHPIGASGARILVTLLHNLERLNLKKGIAALCIGGGMGIAVAIERCTEVE